MRLNAYLARAGIASRRGADELIKAGRVRVNGDPGQLNTFVGRGDRVEVDGAPVVSASRRPIGTIRARWPTRSTTVRRPCGSRTVVTTPAGLCRST